MTTCIFLKKHNVIIKLIKLKIILCCPFHNHILLRFIILSYFNMGLFEFVWKQIHHNKRAFFFKWNMNFKMNKLPVESWGYTYGLETFCKLCVFIVETPQTIIGNSAGRGSKHPGGLLTISIWVLSCFPGGSEVKASASNAGDRGLNLGLGRSPGEGNGNPLQYSCLENPMDGEAW